MGEGRPANLKLVIMANQLAASQLFIYFFSIFLFYQLSAFHLHKLKKKAENTLENCSVNARASVCEVGKFEFHQRQAKAKAKTADKTIMIIKLSSLMRILNIKFKARSKAKKIKAAAALLPLSQRRKKKHIKISNCFKIVKKRTFNCQAF